MTSAAEQRAAGVDRPAISWATPAALLALAAVGWWWSARMADDMESTGPMGIDDMGMATDQLGGLPWSILGTTFEVAGVVRAEVEIDDDGINSGFRPRASARPRARASRTR